MVKKILIIFVVLLIIGAVDLLFFTKPRSMSPVVKGDNFMRLTSSAWQNNQGMPSKYTCDGKDINPPLQISGVPAGAKSLVLIVDDPDAPGGDWVHWLVWNIKPDTTVINENSVPTGAIAGVTDFGKPGWGGPCPPSGSHHYQFKLFALDTVLALESSAGKADLEAAMTGHIIEQAVLVGLYSR